MTSQRHVVTSQHHVVTSQRRRDYHSLAIIHTDRVIDKVGNMQQQKHTHRQTDRQTDRDGVYRASQRRRHLQTPYT